VTIEEQLAAIRAWQNHPRVHPLTCRNDHRHGPLQPAVRDGLVRLVCPDCEYVQRFIPPAVFRLPLADV
jgi:hypothetical protein